jgi:hypothetical protein
MHAKTRQDDIDALLRDAVSQLPNRYANDPDKLTDDIDKYAPVIEKVFAERRKRAPTTASSSSESRSSAERQGNAQSSNDTRPRERVARPVLSGDEPIRHWTYGMPVNFSDMYTHDMHVKSGTLFGKKYAKHAVEKYMVGACAVMDVLEPESARTLFISDGTATSFAFDIFLHRWAGRPRDQRPRLVVYTTNFDVAMQVQFEPQANESVEVHLPPGAQLHAPDSLVDGPDVAKWVEARCSSADVCLLSQTWLDADLGPCGGYAGSKATKSAILKNAKYLIALADRDKLSQDSPLLRAKAANPEAWQALVHDRRDFVRVITTVSSDPPFNPDDSNESRNADILSSLLGANFTYISMAEIETTCEASSPASC